MRELRHWLVLLVAVAVSACGDDPPPTAPTPAPASFVRMDIDGPINHVLDRPGDTLQLRALASFSDGTRTDVTTEATWTAVDPRVLTVSRGLVTGVADGGTIVTATYRGWSNVTNVRVGEIPSQRTFPVSGVVRDAEQGTPVVGAELRMGSGEGEHIAAITDGNGFFNLGNVAGRLLLTVNSFGYEDARVDVLHVGAATSLAVSLTPNPGRYIERTVTGTFEPPPPGYEESHSLVRITTQAGGIFDAMVQSSTCPGPGTLRIWAESGGKEFYSRWTYCGARLRFVVPVSDVQLTIRGIRASDWVLTYREPR